MFNKFRAYSKVFGIIDATKVIIRGIIMEKKDFIVVLDTTELPRLMGNQLPRHVLNALIIKATDAASARQLYLGMLGQKLASIVNDSVYVYDISEISSKLTSVDAAGKDLPVWSFLPLNGSRPQKQASTNQAVVPQQSAPQPRNAVPAMGGSPRSQEFRQNEDTRPTTSKPLTKEQQALAASAGAFTSVGNSNEGVNPKINSAVGKNLNLTNPGVSPTTSEALTSDKASLLRKVGVQLNESNIIEDPDLDAEIAQVKGFKFDNEELSSIDPSTGVLDDATIEQLRKETEGA